jgi:Cof subfamily protein (haloacid dehalogenase superfamily)
MKFMGFANPFRDLRQKSSTRSHQQQETFRMVALDLDGTLLRSNRAISKATVSYLRELDAKGFTIVIATGRPAATCYPIILHKLNLPHPIPVICSNGSIGLLCSIVNGNEDMHTKKVHTEVIFSTPVPRDVTERSIQLTRQLGHAIQYFVGDDIYADPQTEEHRKLTDLYKLVTGAKTIYVQDSFEAAQRKGLPSKLLVLCPQEQQVAMMKAFQQELGDAATIVLGSQGWFIEILHPAVNKGHGLVRMCKYLDIPLEQVVAFGDGDNDYEFIDLAGKGIVMKNGRDIIKKVADEVIEYTNNEDGVRRTLERMERQGLLVHDRVEEPEEGDA